MNNINICLLGEIKTGKTTFLNYVVNNFIKMEYEPTIGVDFATKIFRLDDIEIIWKIWDSTGNKNILQIVNSYFNNISTFLLFFDSSKNYLNNIMYWINYINKNCNIRCKIYLICNNFNAEIISDIELKSFCKSNNLILIKANLKDKNSIESIIKIINNDYISKNNNKIISKKYNKTTYFQLEDNKLKKNRKCCTIM